MKETFIVVEHGELSDDVLSEIIKLKQQHWGYTYQSQKDWIEKFVEKDAIHLLLKVDDDYVGYLSIRNVGMKADDENFLVKGIGNVCIDKRFQNLGYGKKLVEKSNEIILSSNSIGALLCHAHLTEFYRRCGWTNVKYDSLEVDKKPFLDNLMLLNNDLNQFSHVYIDRNF